MNLQELLKSFELSDDQISQVNQAVDTVIEGKLAGKADEIKSLEDELTKAQGDLASANDELAPVRDNAKKEKLTGLMPENADPDKHQDIVDLAKLGDDDDDETIKSKLADTISKRPYLQKPTTDDQSVAKTKTETNNKPVDKEKTETDTQMPTGIK